jgi:hypothetical protein
VDLQNEKGDQQMIPRGQAGQQQSQQQGRRRSSGGGGGGRLPYLKVENVNFDKRTASVLSARMEDDNFNRNAPQVLSLKIAFAGATYLWNLRINNPNLDILADSFGDDETKWVGKEFLLFLETDTHTNNNQIRAEVVKEAKKRG